MDRSAGCCSAPAAWRRSPPSPARALALWLAGLSGGGALLIAGVTALMGYRAFQPVREITRAAEVIDASRLHARLPAHAEDETLGRLAAVLNRMLERLEGAFAAQRRFVDDAAHELRTPLAALRAELDLALRRPREPVEYEQALRSALQEADRLGRLADNLLVLARHDRGLPLQVEKDVDLGLLLRRLADRYRARHPDRNWSLRLAATADATPTGQPDAVGATLRLDGDPLALERLFANLLDNAVQATAPGGRIDVAAHAADARGLVRVQVEDDGRGIPPELLPHIFERFFRADPARGRSGAGLGLAICKSIAAAHGGSIEVESAAGRGARFTVWLPRRGV